MKFRGILFLLCLVFFLGATGCSVVEKIESLDGILEEDPEIQELKGAEYAYFIGEYDVSKKIYMRIQRETKNEVYRNSALYGLACISIITAVDSDELKLGYTMLWEWKEPSDTKARYFENPRMIAVAINKQIDLLQCHPEIRYVTTKREGDLVKTCRDEVEELKATIKKLEHQISVLEAIDQEVQEKRNPL